MIFKHRSHIYIYNACPLSIELSSHIPILINLSTLYIKYNFQVKHFFCNTSKALHISSQFFNKINYKILQ
jgi:hypothetical protein